MIHLEQQAKLYFPAALFCEMLAKSWQSSLLTKPLSSLSLRSMMPNLNVHVQIAVLKAVRERRHQPNQGFTLVELMIVVAVIGVLAAVALPQYLGARNAAQAGAVIGELVGQSKECATFKATTGLGVPPNVTSGAAGVACSSAASQTFSRSWGGTVSGIRCLGAGPASSGSSVATVTVQTNGTLSCALT